MKHHKEHERKEHHHDHMRDGPNFHAVHEALEGHHYEHEEHEHKKHHKRR